MNKRVLHNINFILNVLSEIRLMLSEQAYFFRSNNNVELACVNMLKYIIVTNVYFTVKHIYLETQT